VGADAGMLFLSAMVVSTTRRIGFRVPYRRSPHRPWWLWRKKLHIQDSHNKHLTINYNKTHTQMYILVCGMHVYVYKYMPTHNETIGFMVGGQDSRNVMGIMIDATKKHAQVSVTHYLVEPIPMLDVRT